jgi:hypothetical protein
MVTKGPYSKDSRRAGGGFYRSRFHEQDPDQWVQIDYPETTIVVRTPLEPVTVMPAIKAAVYGAGGDQPVSNLKTMQ